MPRKTTEPVTDTEAVNDSPITVEAKLDAILAFMHRAERRDRWRTAGGFVRGMLGVIPLAVLLGSLWFFYENGEEFMNNLMDRTIQKSAEYSQESLLDQLEGYMQR
jgi:hypothetical protein